jgi:hypothetical protein
MRKIIAAAACVLVVAACGGTAPAHQAAPNSSHATATLKPSHTARPLFLSAAQISGLITGLKSYQGTTVTSATVLGEPVSDGTSETGQVRITWNNGETQTVNFRVYKSKPKTVNMCDLRSCAG